MMMLMRGSNAVYSLESADQLYRDLNELSKAAVTKAQQIYTDSLQTLTDAQSVQLPTTANMSVIQDTADEIKQQVRS